MNLGLSFACGLLTAGGFGTADFIAKLSTSRVGFLRTAFLMQLIGGFFVLPFALADVGRMFAHPWAAFVGVLLGAVNAAATLCLYKGFEVGRLSIVSPIASTAPVVAILLAVAFLGEDLTLQRLVAISLVMLGVILVSIQTSGKSAPEQLAKGTAYAILFMLLGGTLLFGLKPVSSTLGAFLPVLIMRWTGVPVLAAPLLFARSTRPRSGALRLIVTVAFFDTFANVAYTLGVSLGTVAIVSPLGGMFSAITVLLAWVILKERLSRHQMVGFATIILGVATLGAFG